MTHGCLLCTRVTSFPVHRSGRQFHLAVNHFIGKTTYWLMGHQFYLNLNTCVWNIPGVGISPLLDTTHKVLSFRDVRFVVDGMKWVKCCAGCWYLVLNGGPSHRQMPALFIHCLDTQTEIRIEISLWGRGCWGRQSHPSLLTYSIHLSKL